MINDQDADQGNTSVVYGSHQQLNGPDSVGEWRPEERGKSLGQDPHEMPGHVQFTGKAGDGKLDAPARSAREQIAQRSRKRRHLSVALRHPIVPRERRTPAALLPLPNV